ncbi:HNH endonuclease [Gordonia sp. PP30]|uniref:HNH endonuclease n=1 Tax=Gordonia sp. PP30 TaxID=2935861 RepID=UPI001FFFDC61|nr:HNH endonuclease [Gordonia sp. PP30]UQE75802.1 HNH endonuclease [Gordonia sp. PP30]
MSPWVNGNSRTSTPAWRKIRRQAIIRDGNACTRCGADGRQVQLFCDHIIPVAEGGTDTLDNATMLCGPCHQPKTRSEAARGRQRRAARRYRPTEQHPGLSS